MSILVISDTHGYFNETKAALNEKGLIKNKNNKVLLNGDILDRGPDAVRLTDYLITLLKENRLILIRGNHEDLIEDALREIENGKIGEVSGFSHHRLNGTFNTIIQLSGMSIREALANPRVLVRRVKNSPYYRILLPACVNYYETEKHIFTHGWIPCKIEGYGTEKQYYYNPDWRNASAEEWRMARWLNGMKLAFEHGIVEPDKTIICGHINASYGHACIENVCTEFGPDADFSPYYGDGIIAIDSCVAHSGKINCVEIDD